jgi:hypothetical protein
MDLSHKLVHTIVHEAFFDELNSIGNISIALGRYQMKGEISPLPETTASGQ